MAITYINTVDAKEEFSELLNRVFHNKENIVLTRRGKEIAVIISMDDFSLLQKEQSKNDLEEAVESLKEARKHGTILLEDFKKEIG